MFGGSGAVLVVSYVLTASSLLSLFVIFYKLVAISQAQSQSITFLDKFWESKRLDEIFRQAEALKYSPLAAMFREFADKYEAAAKTPNAKVTGLSVSEWPVD